MSKWDKLWEGNAVQPPMEVYTLSKTIPSRWLTEVKTEGDKLQEEAEGHKARYDDLHRITMKWNRRLGAIHNIINRPNSKKTPSEEYASKLDEIEEALSLD